MNQHSTMPMTPQSCEKTSTETHQLAVLLPLTSRGGQERLRHGLDRFLESFAKTTASVDEVRARWKFTFHVGVDQDDPVLNPDFPNALPLTTFFSKHLLGLDWSLTVHHFDLPPGCICTIWRSMAKVAFNRGAEFFVLLGDDIVLKAPNWPEVIRSRFRAIHETTGLPFGFGCVAFSDEAFPGFPTFPVLHRCHFDVFDGEVFPSKFVNQDADPFLFQVYRPWNAAEIAPDAVLANQIGGSGDARYNKQHVQWTGDLLRIARQRALAWLERSRIMIPPAITLDVVVPCYRASRVIIDGILRLPVPRGVSTMFIVVFDHPESADSVQVFREFEARYAADPKVRLRLQASNLGASAARNRGLDESAADWVLFLDDDVIPDRDILERYAKAIRARPHAAGFVGTSLLPPPRTTTQAAVHIANISYFWTIAQKLKDETELPWGVTANLLVRRQLGAEARFQTSFPKTGGGEDIDFCLRARDLHAKANPSGLGWVATPDAVVHHPWWDGGRCRYNHFFGWSRGDGQLIDRFRKTHTYLNLPDLAESLMVIGIFWLAQLMLWATLSMSAPLSEGGLALLLGQIANPWAITCLPLIGASFAMGDVLVEASSWFMVGAFARKLPEIAGVSSLVRFMALFEGLLIRTWSQFGRLWGHWERGRFWANYCRRFKWFGSMWPGHVRVERLREASAWAVRLSVCGIALSIRSWMR